MPVRPWTFEDEYDDASLWMNAARALLDGIETDVDRAFNLDLNGQSNMCLMCHRGTAFFEPANAVSGHHEMCPLRLRYEQAKSIVLSPLEAARVSSDRYEGAVYFIEAVDVDRVKIGWTAKGAKSRAASLQTGSPHKLKVLGAVYGMRDLEPKLHEFFSRYRLHGEWFDLCETGVRPWIEDWLSMEPRRAARFVPLYLESAKGK